MDKHEWLQEIEKLLAAYESYTVETSDRKLEKTANYWINYVNMIHLYHGFSRKKKKTLWPLFMDMVQLPQA